MKVLGDKPIGEQLFGNYNAPIKTIGDIDKNWLAQALDDIQSITPFVKHINMEEAVDIIHLLRTKNMNTIKTLEELKEYTKQFIFPTIRYADAKPSIYTKEGKIIYLEQDVWDEWNKTAKNL